MRAAIESPGSRMDGGLVCSTWDGASEQSLALALRRPVVRCSEQGVRPCLSDDPLSAQSLVLDATTRSALRLNTAKVFIDALDDRLASPVDLRMRMLTVASEIVTNALLHGNLELDSSLRESFDGMMKLQEIIESRVADPDIARRVICLQAHWTTSMVHLLVRDSGRGFDLSKRSDSSMGGPRGSGRGLGIIEALSSRVEFLRGGTVVKAGFER